MSLQSNSKIEATDLTDIYTLMNEARALHGLGQITVPTSVQGSSGTVTYLSNLNSFIQAMNSEGHLSGKCPGITPPPAGDLLQASFLSTLQSQAQLAKDTCHFDSFTCSFNSFNSDCEDYGSYNGTCFSCSFNSKEAQCPFDFNCFSCSRLQ